MRGLSLNSASSRGSDGETGLGSAGGSVEPRTETCRSRLRKTVRTQGGAGEDRSLPDRGVQRTAVMTGLSLLEKNRGYIEYQTCRELFSVDKHASPP